MPTIATDGQSLLIDGRRVWLVSGTVPYARIPRDRWRSHLAGAKQAGLNCIEAPIPWSLHEPRQGAFDFDGDLDLSAFIELAGEMGLRVILRAGPYIGQRWDLGGLPSWLLPEAGKTLRSGSAEFLQACSKYIGELCKRVRDLQVSASRSRSGGPIVMLQSEHQWFCGDETQGAAYLAELDRFFRENGISVPIVNANNLFHHVEGQIDAWIERDHLFSTVRQLRAVNPDQPAMVLAIGEPNLATWGAEPDSPLEPRRLLRRLAEVCAAGGQFNIGSFYGGTAFGFGGGRLARDRHSFITANPDTDALVGPEGERTPHFHAVRRLCTFASSFGRVFSSISREHSPASVSLDAQSDSQVTAIECRGSQGTVVFLFGPEQTPKRGIDTAIVLPNGATLPVSLGKQPVAWVLLDTHLVGRSTLDFCSFTPMGLSGETLVLHAPAGAKGLVSINGSVIELTTPRGATPLVERHEDVTLMLCNDKTIETVFLVDGGAVCGAWGLDDSTDEPIAAPGAGQALRVAGEKAEKIQARPLPQRRSAPKLTGWSTASTDAYVDGESERFATIPGPSTMERLGVSSGYGWLRLRVARSSAKKVNAAFYEAGDRLHLYHDGDQVDIVGVGPGASGDIAGLSLKKREQTLTVLVDNLGRWSEGHGLGEPKGIYGPVFHAGPMRAGASKLETSAPLSPLEFRSPVFGIESHDRTDPERLTWRITHRKKSPLLVAVDGFAGTGLLIVNDEPRALIGPGATGRYVLRQDEELKRGVNVIQIAVVGSIEEHVGALKSGVSFKEGVEDIAEKATWAFAKWEPPATNAFEALEKSQLTPASLGKLKGRPRWWRASFECEPSELPLRLDATGLSKGQLFLNGRNLCRYFVATNTGKAVGPQTQYPIPESWLNEGGTNELLIFDEHGYGPSKCKLAYGTLTGA